METRVAIGCVHGRFQPPHNGHLEYIKAAKAVCNFLLIGVTRYDLLAVASCEVAPHRGNADANPLTYYERTRLLRKMLVAEGVSELQFAFTPFPIETPNSIPQFVPKTVTCFTTIYDDWNRHKVLVLRTLGYRVYVLWERQQQEKIFCGRDIRAAIRAGNSRWKHAVPPSIADDISSLASRGSF